MPGKDLLTLFTCTPYAVNTHRLLGTGHRVPYEPGSVIATTGPAAVLTLQSWMYWLVAGALLVLILVALVAARELRRNDVSAEEGSHESPQA